MITFDSIFIVKYKPTFIFLKLEIIDKTHILLTCVPKSVLSLYI